jgi:hypothetical protein
MYLLNYKYLNIKSRLSIREIFYRILGDRNLREIFLKNIISFFQQKIQKNKYIYKKKLKKILDIIEKKAFQRKIENLHLKKILKRNLKNKTFYFLKDLMKKIKRAKQIYDKSISKKFNKLTNILNFFILQILQKQLITSFSILNKNYKFSYDIILFLRTYIILKKLFIKRFIKK